LVLGFGRRRGAVSEEEEAAVAVAMDGVGARVGFWAEGALVW